jgi:2-alkyl-3-oxoalkanoate reductase
MRVILDAIRHLEETVVDAGGIALRYGGFYGSLDDAQLELVRKRRFPIVGNGGGVWSFVHLDDAAAATVLALERGEPGTTRPEARSGSPRSRLPTAASSRSGRS